MASVSGKNVLDHYGNEYSKRNVDKLINIDESVNPLLLKEMLTVKEDNIRYCQVACVVLYGLGLRIHTATTIDENEKISTLTVERQIECAATYLSFKKKFSSGWGMNSFWIIVDYSDGLSKIMLCMLDLLERLFSRTVFSSIVFLVAVNNEDENQISALETKLQSEIAIKVCCKKETIMVKSIDMNFETWNENQVQSILKLFDKVATQVYQDPNPFEPPGMDMHDAKAIIETVSKKYYLRHREWCQIINNIYTMIPN